MYDSPQEQTAETLRQIYGIDIQGFMQESLGKWLSP